MNTQELLRRVRTQTNMKFNRGGIQFYVDKGILVKRKSGVFAVSGLETNDYIEDSVDALIKFFNALSIRATAKHMSERLGITVTVKTVTDLYDGDLFHGRVPQDELGELEQQITQRENDMQGASYHDACAVIASARQHYNTREIADAIGCHPSTIRKMKASNPNSRHKMEWPMYYKLREFADKHRYGRND